MDRIYERVTREQLEPLVMEGLDDNELAARFKVTVRTIERAMIRHGFREPRPQRRFTFEEEARMQILAAEGMPATWIADDIGREVSSILSRVGRRFDANLEWKRAWQEIRRSEALYELHRQFAPSPRVRL